MHMLCATLYSQFPGFIASQFAGKLIRRLRKQDTCFRSKPINRGRAQSGQRLIAAKQIQIVLITSLATRKMQPTYLRL